MTASQLKTRLSTKGQVILPKAVRDLKGWKPGEELVVEVTSNGVLLKLEEPIVAPTRLEDVFGMLHRPGRKPLTIEEMNAGVRERAAQRYRALDEGD